MFQFTVRVLSDKNWICTIHFLFKSAVKKKMDTIIWNKLNTYIMPSMRNKKYLEKYKI